MAHKQLNKGSQHLSFDMTSQKVFLNVAKIYIHI